MMSLEVRYFFNRTHCIMDICVSLQEEYLEKEIVEVEIVSGTQDLVHKNCAIWKNYYYKQPL